MEGKRAGALAQSDIEVRLFDALLQDSAIPFAYLDQNFNVVQVSRAFARIMGREVDALVGCNYFDIFPDADGEALFRALAPAQLQPRSLAEGTLLPVASREGAVEGMLLVLDYALRTSALPGRSPSDATAQSQFATGVAWRFDVKAWRFIEASGTPSALLGYSKQSWCAPGFFENHVHPDDRDAVAHLFLNGVRDGQSHEMKHRFITADGDTVQVSSRLDAGVKGQQEGVLRGRSVVVESAVETDAMAHHVQQPDFGAVINAISDAVIYLDDRRRIVTVNDRVTQLFGYRPDELVGHAMGMLSADIVDDQCGCDGSMREWIYRRQDGTSFIGETIGNRVCDVDGHVVGYIALIRDVTAREHHQDELNRLKSTLDRTLDCIFMFEPTTLKFFYSNEGAIKQVGYTQSELLKMSAVDIMPQLDEAAFRRLVMPLTDGAKDSLTFETVFGTKDGRDIPVEILLQYIAPSNETPRFMAIVRDTAERRQAEERMHKLSMALEQTADSICITDRDSVIEYVNPAFSDITGYDKQEVIGQKISILRSGRHERAFYRQLWDTISNGEVFQDIIVNRKKDGTLYYDEKTITPLKNEYGDIVHFVSAGRDITERVETQKRLQYLAHHDVLTGLPNRALLMERIDHALTLMEGKENKLAVIFLDLDRFKIINDTLGHGAGDRLLQLLADRFRRCVFTGTTVARLSGDEFAMLMENVSNIESVVSVARNLMGELAKPFVIEDRDFFVTASIGISVAPGDGGDAQAMLKHAETAMYRAKDFGRNTYQFYSADMSSRAFERLSLETSLRYALEREQFVLHYQPQVDICTGKVVGVEALLRWQHPDLGVVSPADFIPILEETGLIMPVGKWVLHTACKDAMGFGNGAGDDVRISVNLSARQFSDPMLIDSIQRSLRETGLPPDRLEIEITESVIMQDDRLASRAFNAIREMQVHLAIDDFGTGYSSLAYLKRFPINTLKIDRTFVRDIISDPDDAAIVRAIVAMTESLKLRTIAEGVETQAQLEFLRNTGCDIVQGYFYSPPIDIEALRLFFDRNAASVKNG